MSLAEGGYAEVRPSARLAAWVECCWMQKIQRSGTKRVLPDGCADIIFSQRTGMRLAGLMTRAAEFEQCAGDVVFGVRFRPGMAAAFVDGAGQLTDRVEPLETFWGRQAGVVGDGLAELKTLSQRAAWVEQFLHPAERLNGKTLSERQRRRVCVERAGVAPKYLQRILRFRNLVENAARTEPANWARAAADSGYFDQAHMIREFQEFAGCTPGRYLQSLRASAE